MTNSIAPRLPYLLLLTLLSGCATKEPPPPPPPPSPEQVRAQQTLEEGIRLYQGGHYYMAEQQFLTPEVWAGDQPIQLQSLKYLAFSYCVTQRPKQCRFAFERALQIDPSFQLDSAEQGHPLWGPVFTQAQGQ
ncbi:TssQ family T6SS-associated lipoprotein [Ectopseudomonas khazarica]|uniref:TssQ family T6SS-associated lipoprotein n=1 Tax=Ectopseudomonas khazarica TaxID=2502979 RepID=UPI00069127F4|nr:TssQ family T6SS-associated lipoprotein [Pseudomonas khazarica]QTS86155.1 TssQ family T6SS-associated lipoprotein [Pseudomonas khazarica]